MAFIHQRKALLTVALLATLGLMAVSLQVASAHQPESSATEAVQVSAANSQPAPLFNNLGNYHFPISTQSEQAQRYFDQGLILAYGFNHAEAVRSFQAAIKLDPTCAMCHWGLAYVLGPNINAAMEADAVPTAWEAIQEAVALSSNATPREQAYIQAMAQRYTEEHTEDRSALNLAYANAMRQVTQQYPDDLDAATLFAEALMDTMPWDYWQENGDPKPEGVEIMKTLESVLQRNPDHPGANHLYIHAVEKERPELGIEAADRLLNFAPGSGHLVHMPSHIYIRVGRYHDAVVANQQGAQADQEYANAHQPSDIYRFGYIPHNHHFLWFAAMMEGQSELALNAAQDTAGMVDPEVMRQPDQGTLQHFYTIPLYTMVRFSQWDDILAQPNSAEGVKYPTGVWHYARGMAFTAKGQLNEAAQELAALQAIANDPEMASVFIWDINTTADILQIATQVLSGELAAAQGNYDQAIAHLEKGVELEDALKYTEPADWYAPVRQSLAAVLLRAGRFAEAEQAYRADLATYPNNGWSLHGLAQSLSAQGKTEEAAAVQAQFESAWQYADVPLIARQ